MSNIKKEEIEKKEHKKEKEKNKSINSSEEDSLFSNETRKNKFDVSKENKNFKSESRENSNSKKKRAEVTPENIKRIKDLNERERDKEKKISNLIKKPIKIFDKIKNNKKIVNEEINKNEKYEENSHLQINIDQENKNKEYSYFDLPEFSYENCMKKLRELTANKNELINDFNDFEVNSGRSVGYVNNNSKKDFTQESDKDKFKDFENDKDKEKDKFKDFDKNKNNNNNNGNICINCEKVKNQTIIINNYKNNDNLSCSIF